MKKVGVVGIGDMGSGLAKNLLKAGFEVCGFDPAAGRLDAFAAAGGVPMASPKEVGARAEAVFIMVMMFIVQLSQITIAKIVVEYAAFAAARSAIVWIPANLGVDGAQPNRIGTLTFLGEEWDDQGRLYRVYEEARGEPVDRAAIQYHHLGFTLTNQLAFHAALA